MLGALTGDIIGSVFESAPIKSKHFPLFSQDSTFTDDSVLTVAVADALLADADFASTYREYFRRFPDRGYGSGFCCWAMSNAGQPYNSFGNGSAMRVSPVGWAFDSLESVLDAAERSAVVSHNHAQGIRGAQAVAAAIFMARRGRSKTEIKDFVAGRFGYDLDRTLEAIRPGYAFDVSCEGSVPESIIAFLESSSFEDAIRNAVSLGGDSDTMACISGAIAEAYYGMIPAPILAQLGARLPPELGAVVDRFRQKFILDTQYVRLPSRKPGEFANPPEISHHIGNEYWGFRNT